MIKELNKKHLVFEWDDIRESPLEIKEKLAFVEGAIGTYRHGHGKKDNQYLVLNMDDEIDFGFLLEKVKKQIYRDHSKEIEAERRGEITVDEMIYSFTPIGKVKDIAVDLVNAVLKTKKNKELNPQAALRYE